MKQETMKIRVSDDSMVPYLKVGDEVEVVEGKPHPNGKICVVNFRNKTIIREVFRQDDMYKLKPLNPNYKTEYVLVSKAKTYIIKRRIPMKK